MDEEIRREGIELLRKGMEEGKPVAYFFEVEGVYELGANIVGEFLPQPAQRNFFKLRNMASDQSCLNLLGFIKDNKATQEKEMTEVELVSAFYGLEQDDAEKAVAKIKEDNAKESKQWGAFMGKMISAAVKATV